MGLISYNEQQYQKLGKTRQRKFVALHIRCHEVGQMLLRRPHRLIDPLKQRYLCKSVIHRSAWEVNRCPSLWPYVGYSLRTKYSLGSEEYLRICSLKPQSTPAWRSKGRWRTTSENCSSRTREWPWCRSDILMRETSWVIVFPILDESGEVDEF